MPENLAQLFPLLSLLPVVLAVGFMLGQWYLRYRNREQRTAFRLMKQVFDHTHDGVTITDPKGNIIAVNRTFTQVTGYREDEVIGKNPRILSSGYHDAAFYENYWQTLMRDGIWQGEIWNRRKDGEVFLEWLTCKVVKDARGEVSHYVAVFTDITEHRRQEARLEHATEHDRLTGLPNTATTLRELSRQIPNLQQRWCLALIDFDNFRLVNASYGFAVGDQLLTSLARRLRECGQSLVARHAADVFIVAFPLTGGNDDGERLAHINRARECLSKPFSVMGRLMEFSFSIGATVWDNASVPVADVLQQAELALHAAKSRSAGQTRFYTEDLRSENNPLARLQGLRDALSNHELSLHFQPLVTAESEQIHALEVLLRWDHPVMGRIPPDQFIPLAERHGLMELLGQWVLEQALKHYATWQQQGIAPHHIAVNVSPLEFQSENFVDNVRSALKKHQVAAQCLELELTEGVFVQQDVETLEKLDALSHQGIQLAIDDFGTGYSSLAYLKHLPVHKLKLDRAFVKGLPVNEADRAIVESTLALCRGLKMSVVAEGVENQAQADYLRRKGCDLLQGYYYGRPNDAQATTQLLIQQKVRAARAS
ncbi:putative bifunctional diguanylate cyclase/phosphodiesterase [Marinospirillum alkaliphilum]|uniref:cyclic-guanylate-specific phosphodiesterase n=1 Tax=Marinospirillum alkaliphilum DSM 21637 TaxID=1122209 RepID=A0A1K1WTY2_9GAMM|nr:GGDEF domain-containing phosphodiesterase [Marinospirillum alkaliphilum]SFX40830.1 PAS domain S-box-containing protein/diguanylate cyclase (GGDEF) domain-containing protein [Marinospirillum alkaliphilum DSM 21637]